MPTRDLPARPNLEQYKKQAKDFLKALKAGDADALRRARAQHAPAGDATLAGAQFVIAREHGFDSWPKFARHIETLTGKDSVRAIWKAAEDAVVAGDAATLDRLLRDHREMLRTERPQSAWLGGLAPQYATGGATDIIAHEHAFDGWDQFAAFAGALKDKSSVIAQFERAVDAIVSGDAATLARLLQQNPDLVRARSARSHHSMLLHYVGANGVEGFRQRTPGNIVQITEMLIDAGAEVDAVADMYGGGCTTLGLAATSIHPKVAGVLHDLIDVLIARGARVDAPGSGRSYPLVNGCLANGRAEAAEYLASRGAPLDLEGAAGVGRLDLVKSFFNADGSLKETATPAQMRDGFTWACQYGRTDVVEYLLDRISVEEIFARPFGQTGLHWAAHGGHVSTVKALLKRGAPVDVTDREFKATPLGWALHGWCFGDQDAASDDAYAEVVRLLIAAGSPVKPEWLDDETIRSNPRAVAALSGKSAES